MYVLVTPVDCIMKRKSDARSHLPVGAITKTGGCSKSFSNDESVPRCYASGQSVGAFRIEVVVELLSLGLANSDAILTDCPLMECD